MLIYKVCRFTIIIGLLICTKTSIIPLLKCNILSDKIQFMIKFIILNKINITDELGFLLAVFSGLLLATYQNRGE